MKNHIICKLLNRVTSFIGVIALSMMILCISANVFGRFLFNYSFRGVEEYGYLFFVWLVFLGTAVCYDERQLISINVFVLMLPDKAQDLLFVLKRIFMLVANVILLVISYQFMLGSMIKLTSLMRIPYMYHYISIVVLFAVATIVSFRDVILAITKKESSDKERHAE
ncbi:TRAP transporter small permease subunit [uncultured Oscillibacter sp.]|uniref:TRAP transporter small permease n=1 Tax=uncultured Oscillibacter sp. TaxID=876091 RepID=UPI0028049BD0|nr:TRAP transporter small permease subunit [uncultured Oscillibacter sp.]